MPMPSIATPRAPIKDRARMIQYLRALIPIHQHRSTRACPRNGEDAVSGGKAGGLPAVGIPELSRGPDTGYCRPLFASTGSAERGVGVGIERGRPGQRGDLRLSGTSSTDDPQLLRSSPHRDEVVDANALDDHEFARAVVHAAN